MKDGIEIKNLSKSFVFRRFGLTSKKTIYEDVNIFLEKGHIYGLIGKNGSGKSTFLKHISGVYREEDTQTKYTVAGLLTTHPGVIEALSIRYNFFLLCTLHRVDKPIHHLEKSLASFLDLYKLNGDDLLLVLSTGMRANLCILVLLEKDADLYLFDESSNGLDQEKIQIFKKALIELKTRNKILIIVMHDQEFINEVSDSILICENQSIKNITKSSNTYFNS